MKRFCSEDLKLMKKVCSEEDDLYGASNVPILTRLLVLSNVLKAPLPYGREECFTRYGKLFAQKEGDYQYLSKAFNKVYENLFNDRRVRYLQGRLFVPGALKEFDLKGLK